MEFAPLPVSAAFLDTFRLQARGKIRSQMSGGHTSRRAGDSLEFREFVAYTPGDELRHVDWMASARAPYRDGLTPWSNWLRRHYIAEEHLKLVISIDTRPTMLHPTPATIRRRRNTPTLNISRLQMARWIAEAVSVIALQEHDRVTLHRLFGNQPGDARAVTLRQNSNTGDIIQALDQITEKAIGDELLQLDTLATHLPPAAAWVIISDFYFGIQPENDADATHLNARHQLLRRVEQAVDHTRWVILIDLDTWAYENARFDGGLHKILSPYSTEDAIEFNASGEELQRTERRINAHKQAFQQATDYSQWTWVPPQNRREFMNMAEFARFFEQRFVSDRYLQRLFMREV